MTARYAQPCFDHEYIDPNCPNCGWLATVESTVFICSNPHCDAVWDADPHGHCPKCIKPSGVGYSTISRPLLSLEAARQALSSRQGAERDGGAGG